MEALPQVSGGWSPFSDAPDTSGTATTAAQDGEIPSLSRAVPPAVFISEPDPEPNPEPAAEAAAGPALDAGTGDRGTDAQDEGDDGDELRLFD